MIGPRETLDVDAAVLDPADHFESPMNVVRDPRLTKGEKQRVLESWIRDAQLLSQARGREHAGHGATAAAGSQAGAVGAAEAKVVDASWCAR